MNDALAEQWAKILAIRGEVTKGLEEARNQKVIGHSLDAGVTLSLPSDLFEAFSRHEEEFKTVFIVSSVTVLCDESLEGAYQSDQILNLKVKVIPASGKKCERCWIHDPTVGDDVVHKNICARCVQVLEEADE